MYRMFIDTTVSVSLSAVGTVHARTVEGPGNCAHGTYHDPECWRCVARDVHRDRIEREREGLPYHPRIDVGAWDE